MLTIKDIYDMVAYDYFKNGHCCIYGELTCGICPKFETWCFVDSYVLTMDYLTKGVYYG